MSDYSDGPAALDEPVSETYFDCQWCRAGNGARFIGVSGLLGCQMHREHCRPMLTWAGRIRSWLGLSMIRKEADHA